MALFIYQLWIETYYFDEKYSEKIGWKADDSFRGNQGPLLGKHHFSDYSAMVNSSQRNNPWEIPNVYPPFAVLVFKGFSNFDPSTGLLIWLIVSIFLMLLPIFFAKRTGLSHSQFILTVLILITSAPFLATLDRGNQIAVIPILILLFYLLLQNGWTKTAGLCLAFAISLKIYPAILGIYLIRNRNWRAVLWTTLSTILITFVSLVYFQGINLNLWRSTQWMSAKNEIAQEAQPMLFSFIGMLNNLAIHFFGYSSWQSGYILTSAIPFSVALVLLLLFLSPKRYGIYTFIPFLYCLQLIPLQSYTYTRIWTFIALPLLLMQGPSKIKVVWLLIVGLNLSPFVIWIRDEVNLLPTLGMLLFLILIFSQFANNLKDFLKKWI
jgi:hypothetical protein